MYPSDLLSCLHTGICLMLLAGIGVLSWQCRAQQVIICGTLVLYAQYMIWRGLHTLNISTWYEAAISCTVYFAELYGFGQLGFFGFQIWKATEWHAPAIQTYRSVDIFVPIVNEPLSILRRTLVSCLNQHYPKEKYRVYVLDDGHREDVHKLAHALGCQYLQRSDRVHAKAGNLNHALGKTTGDLIAIFDTDHAPAASFLMKTVGFFDDKKVSFVQTPQHFYNADIFQKNLSLDNKIPCEQALFFRVIEPGRDRHNSAFFAGSGGIFRRETLSEIGGFQTDTITEDIHTSLLVHAKGYESRYLNVPLAAGLMPETFESLLKQRARWASGTWQMFFRSNPLTLPGLTWAQRINYLAAIWYFGFGVPRVICLLAPLSGLLFGIAPVNASPWELTVYYGSYFVASLLMMKMVSKGTRMALWSEVYEIAMCFRTSWAVMTTLVQPYAEREFVITPKGLQQERRKFSFRSVHPHLVTMGLLLLGLGMGIDRSLHNGAEPGIQVTILWGAVNVFLLCITMIAAFDAQQWRKSTRLPRQVPCTISSTIAIGNEVHKGTTEDLSEEGALIRMPASARVMPDDNGSQGFTLTLAASNGKDLTLKAEIRAQKITRSGDVTYGVNFIDLDEKTVHALITIMFGDESIWSKGVPPSGIWKNLWWLVSVVRVPFSLSRASFRRSRRTSCHAECQGSFFGHRLNGIVTNISEHGLMAEFIGTAAQLEEEGAIQIDHCVLQGRRMWSRDQDGKVVAGFRIDCIKEGEWLWRQLLSPIKRPTLTSNKAA
jgi:cellulose synthase (UDP-forming)